MAGSSKIPLDSFYKDSLRVGNLKVGAGKTAGVALAHTLHAWMMLMLMLLIQKQ